MKKMKIFALMLFAGATIFTSCKKDETPMADPTITFQGGVTSIVFPTTSAIDVNVNFAAEGKIESVTLLSPSLTTNGNTTTTITDKMGTAHNTNSKGETSTTYLFQVPTADLTAALGYHTSGLTYTFTITDQEGMSTTANFTVTTVATGNPINTYTAVIMGNQSSSNGSFYATTTNQTYLLSAAATNSSIIDFCHFYGATNAATLAAPNDADAQTIFSSISGWATKNATKFTKQTSITTAAFDAMTDDLGFASLTSTDSKANTLAVGSIVSFQTAAGKKGLIKVTGLTGSSSTAGDITVVVKVQQ